MFTTVAAGVLAKTIIVTLAIGEPIVDGICHGLDAISPSIKPAIIDGSEKALTNTLNVMFQASEQLVDYFGKK